VPTNIVMFDTLASADELVARIAPRKNVLVSSMGPHTCGCVTHPEHRRAGARRAAAVAARVLSD